ncbi:MAG: hypothetical protein ACRYFZ_09545 [Janthinobacterium lividum]
MATPSTQLSRAAEAVKAAGPRLALLYAQTILALVVLRVQEKGLAGKTYATGDYPLFWFKDKQLNARGKTWYENKKKRTKAERKTDPANWASFRTYQGLSSAVVNLTYTGRMFRSLNAIPAGSNGAIYYAALAAADMESANKVEWNITRYGNFLKPTEAEEAEARQAVVDEVNRIVKQVFQT